MEAFFAAYPEALAVAASVLDAVGRLGPYDVHVSRSQVALRRRRGFAYLWRPGQYVASDVPVVLSLALPREVASPRWKQVVHPTPRTWMHHLELRRAEEVDEEVRAWLAGAYDAAA